jgi:hypothetical protein
MLVQNKMLFYYLCSNSANQSVDFEKDIIGLNESVFKYYFV